jgi:hypothetical protein
MPDKEWGESGVLAIHSVPMELEYMRDRMGQEEFNDLRRLCKTHDELLTAFAQWEHDDHQQ